MARRSTACDPRWRLRGDYRIDGAAAMAEPLEARLLLSASLTSVAAFNGTNGLGPIALVEDSAGDLFGITASDTTTQAGEVFEVPAGSTSIEVLYHFTGGADGKSPISLVIDPSGNLFGTTSAGGAGGYGTLFEIPHGASAPSTLLAFTENQSKLQAVGVNSAGDVFLGNDGGAYELATGSTTIAQISSVIGISSLTLASSGNLYGTTPGADDDFGNLVNDGSVFEINTTSDTTTTLATFPAGGADGSGPVGVTVDAAGDVYGVTNFQRGLDLSITSCTAFEIKSGSGAITTLYTFDNSSTVGTQPFCAPVLDSAGDLIGLNVFGGANDDGTVWEIPAAGGAAEDLADLTNIDVPDFGVGFNHGAGFATVQDPAAAADAVHPDVSGTLATIYIAFGGGGETITTVTGQFAAGLIDAVAPLEEGGGGSEGGGGGGSSGTAGVNASSVSGSVPESVVGGAAAKSNVSVSVENTSSSAVKGNVTVQLYVSADDSLTGATPVGSPITKKVSLKASASKAIPIKIKAFPSEPAGKYEILASVTGPSGNTSTAAGPSLTIAPATVSTLLSALQPVPTSNKPGGKETLDFTLTNRGNSPATGTASMAIALSTSPTGSSAQSIASVPVRVKLKAGAAGHYKVKFSLPSPLSPAVYYVVGTLDVAPLGDTNPSDGIADSTSTLTIS
jgi:uncharacterized repeat protein (TIGR03803 family)